MTPHKAYTKRKPDVSHLREFGSDVWVLDESGTRSKLDPKSKKMIFMGFMYGPKAVRYYNAKIDQLKYPGMLRSMKMKSWENWKLGRFRVYKLRGRKRIGQLSKPSQSRKLSQFRKTNLLHQLQNHRPDNYDQLHSKIIPK